MKKFLKFYLFLFLPVFVFAAPETRILKIVIDGDINPVATKYIIDNIERADQEGYECLLIQMDTPGGLLESTKS